MQGKRDDTGQKESYRSSTWYLEISVPMFVPLMPGKVSLPAEKDCCAILVEKRRQCPTPSNDAAKISGFLFLCVCHYSRETIAISKSPEMIEDQDEMVMILNLIVQKLRS